LRTFTAILATAGAVSAVFFPLYPLGQPPVAPTSIYPEDSPPEGVLTIISLDRWGNDRYLGNAFVVAPGTLATTAHVLLADRYLVRTTDGVILPVELVCRSQDTDVALLRVKYRETAPLFPVPLRLADQAPPRGEPVTVQGWQRGRGRRIAAHVRNPDTTQCDISTPECIEVLRILRKRLKEQHLTILGRETSYRHYVTFRYDERLEESPFGLSGSPIRDSSDRVVALASSSTKLFLLGVPTFEITSLLERC
jgi:hypothetical protein